MLEKIIKKTTGRDSLIIFLSATAVIAFWRGLWNLMDKYLFPGNFLLSQLTSIIGGIFLLFIISKLK